MARTEDQILSQAPLEVTLGSEKYQIKVLTILKQQAWRKSLSAEFSSMLNGYSESADQQRVSHGLAVALTDFPEKIAELVFSYAPYLPKDKILDEATEEQLAAAFSVIMSVAFPFLAQLGTVTQLVRGLQ
jgi:hypothetical protein